MGRANTRLSEHKFAYLAWGAILSLTPDAQAPASPGKSAAPPLATPPCGCVSVVSGGGGRIIEWVRQIDREGWDCVIMADEPVSGPPWQGRYAFDPRSIRARDTDQPPADLAGAE
jgi:hypothetical protein